MRNAECETLNAEAPRRSQPFRVQRFAFIVLVWLAACTPASPSRPAVPVAPVTGLPAGTAGLPWWNDSVFYEVFVRSFYDSNGDGIGDLNGLTAKLDYLNDGDPATSGDLGVTALWLMPVQAAASYHGYDPTDYYHVNPDFGGNDDFKRLMAEAHRRNLRVIVDLVLNHTSDRHPWFVAAQDPASPYHDWYVWSSDDHAGDANWHRASSGQYYYAQFSEHQPDLNYANPAVTAEMQNVVRFWLQDLGVDGFRLDAAQYLIEAGTVRANADETHAWFRDFRTFYKQLKPDAMTVGEIWNTNVLSAKYAQGDELDLAFDFDLARALVVSAGARRAAEAARVLPISVRLFPPAGLATFLTNHDQNRVMSQVAGDVIRARAAATLLLTAPGVPFVYYGEEIGMLGMKPDEELRTPMQWSADANGGFTTGKPWEAPNPDYLEGRSVAAETGDAGSLLSAYRRLIALRNAHGALRVGATLLLDTGNPAVYAVLRAGAGESVLVLVNLDKSAVTDYRLSWSKSDLRGTYELAPLLDSAVQAPAALAVDEQGGAQGYQPLPELPAGGSWAFQLQTGK
jgi:alpha-amylase